MQSLICVRKKKKQLLLCCDCGCGCCLTSNYELIWTGNCFQQTVQSRTVKPNIELFNLLATMKISRNTQDHEVDTILHTSQSSRDQFYIQTKLNIVRHSNTTHLHLSGNMRASVLLSLSVLWLTSGEEKKRSDYYTGAVLEYHPVDSQQFLTAAEVQQSNAMIAVLNV